MNLVFPRYLVTWLIYAPTGMFARLRARLFDILAKASRGGPLSSIAILAAYRKEMKPGDPETSK